MSFDTRIKTEYTAERVIDFDTKKNQFVLTYNLAGLNHYAVFFFIIGLLFSIWILPHIVKNAWLTLIFFSVFSLPFLLFGIRYYFMARSNKIIVIDISRNQIVYSEKLVIPFKSIKQIYLTQINFYDPERFGTFFTMRKIPSWQLTIEDFRGNTIILCKPERKAQAKMLLEEFSKAMDVPINPVRADL